MLNFENLDEKFVRIVNSENWQDLQDKFNSSPKGLQNDIKALFRDASRLSMKQKQQVFDMIKILLD